MLDQAPLFISPKIFASFPNLSVGQSTRHRGCSLAPYASLNLGLYTDDEEEAVKENRKRFFSALGFEAHQSAGSYQVHGDAVLLVEAPQQLHGYDAFISNKKGIVINATIADCVPILIFDPQTESFAAIHAGWKGTVAQIVTKTLKKMLEVFNTKPEDCFAYIGACIAECSFEVDLDVAQHFDEAFQRWDSEKQKYFVDLKQKNKSLLLNLGVPEGQIEVSPYCTVLDNEHFFSHRAEKGKTGRMLAAIGFPA